MIINLLIMWLGKNVMDNVVNVMESNMQSDNDDDYYD